MVRGYFIEASDLRRAPLHAAVSPIPSLSCALRDAAGANRNQTPPSWCAAMRAHLKDADYRTLAPFITRETILVPDPLVGLVDPPGESIKDGIERMIATPLDAFHEEIVECRTLTGNPAWIEAERDPERWLRRYVAALLRAWKGFAPVWRDARMGLEREAERVRTATLNAAQVELLEGLLDIVTIRGDELWFDCEVYTGKTSLPEFGLILMPIVGGPRVRGAARKDGVLTTVSYPLPRQLSLAADEDGTSLDALLGVPRAQLLRRLRAPATIGSVAEMLHTVPSAASYHVDALEAAGLVQRERRGRHVLVARTERGDDLLALYAPLARHRPHARLRTA